MIWDLSYVRDVSQTERLGSDGVAASGQWDVVVLSTLTMVMEFPVSVTH